MLTNVSLKIDRGEIVSVVGPSGAGKSTLLHIIGTLDKPDSGTVMFDGVEVSKFTDKKLSEFRNTSIGFVFQSHQLLPEFTLLENVMLPALIRGEKMKKAEIAALNLLEEVGLKDRASHKPSQLSGGECQRGAVARALINNPGYILADEPTGSLDSTNRDELHELFFRMRESHGCTFVIVTHDNSLAKRCDRILNLADGKLVS